MAEAQRCKELGREVEDLRSAREILKLASAFYAPTELDRRLRWCTGSSTRTAKLGEFHPRQPPH